MKGAIDELMSILNDGPVMGESTRAYLVERLNSLVNIEEIDWGSIEPSD